MELAGKHVAILGVGRSGRAAAALALRHGAIVSVWDQAGPEAFEGMDEAVTVHPHATLTQAEGWVSDLLIVSPGIETTGPLVRAFSRQAGEVLGEVEFASRFYQGKIVGITGTNGKTTTTGLVSLILEKAGLGGTACGNYGTPLSEVVLAEGHPAAIALELSSFQLETVSSLRPDVVVWLNFSPDHMDRYPSVDAYRAAKSRIFRNLGDRETVVIHDGEVIPEVSSTIITFSTSSAQSPWFYDGRRILRSGTEVIALEESTSLRGLHNAENAMAAMAACEAFGVPHSLSVEALQGCSAPLHRCELVRTLDGVEYLNDSKSTNLHALESAVRSQSRPIVLIAGGKEKGLDYSPLVPVIRDRVLSAVTFGEIGKELCGVFAAAVPSESVGELGEAVRLAQQKAPRGSVVLFSPGTSSFDQFSGYEHRGDSFREYVHLLN